MKKLRGPGYHGAGRRGASTSSPAPARIDYALAKFRRREIRRVGSEREKKEKNRRRNAERESDRFVLVRSPVSSSPDSFGNLVSRSIRISGYIALWCSVSSALPRVLF